MMYSLRIERVLYEKHVDCSNKIFPGVELFVRISSCYAMD